MNLKTKWREYLLKIRKSIPTKRRIEAAKMVKEHLVDMGFVLSFKPMGSEIDLNPLNETLKMKGKLFLVPYEIESLKEVPLEKLDCILVPGLGFDQKNFRLGYGKGYYDQFLKNVIKIKTIGVGFKEQLCSEPLPKDPWDIPTNELLLV